MAGRYDFKIEQGATFRARPFTWRDQSGSPVDLTGASVVLTAKAARGAMGFQWDSEKDPYLYLDEKVPGRFWLAVDATTTASLDAARYDYDLEVHLPTETVRLLEGYVTIDPEVRLP